MGRVIACGGRYVFNESCTHPASICSTVALGRLIHNRSRDCSLEASDAATRGDPMRGRHRGTADFFSRPLMARSSACERAVLCSREVPWPTSPVERSQHSSGFVRCFTIPTWRRHKNHVMVRHLPIRFRLADSVSVADSCPAGSYFRPKRDPPAATCATMTWYAH